MSRLIAIVVLFAIALAACSSPATPTSAPPTTVPPTAAPPTVAPTAEILSCDALITRAMDTADSACGGLGRNEACYGNNSIQAQLRSGSFAKAGDIAPLTAVQRIATAPLDEAKQVWGIAVLKAQADIPDTLPGQNVTFLLFGDTTVDNPTSDMHAVTVSTGIGQLTCKNAPPSALLVQSPEGQKVAMNINGAEMTLGSTVYITAVANQSMTVATLQGDAVVTAFGTTQNVAAGAQIALPLGNSAGAANGLSVVGPPSAPQPINPAALAQLPTRLLDQPVNIPAPLVAPTGTPTLVIPSPVPPTATAIPPTATDLPPTASPTPCVVRADWQSTYTASDGDTLSRIAQRYGIQMSDLQAANCLSDANPVTNGQVLRVPFDLVTATPTLIPARATTAPTGPNLRADATTIAVRACTTVRWDIDDIQAIYFEGQPTQGHASKQVCPTQTTTYTLIVVTTDRKQTPYTITITVS